jgi:hypothetical protein
MAKLSRPPDNTNYHDKNSEKKKKKEEEGMYSVYFSLKKHSFDGVIPES